MDAEDVNFNMPTQVDINFFSQSLYLSYAFDSVTLTSTTTHKTQGMEGDYDDVNYLAGTIYDGLKQFNYRAPRITEFKIEATRKHEKRQKNSIFEREISRSIL